MRLLLSLFIACSLSFAALADPLQLVITPTRSETPVNEIGSSVTVITEEDIKRQQKQSVVELLREVPGLDVTQAGGVGQTSSVFIRGAPSEHTLVLIDGVEVNDPTSTAGSFGFENLNTDNIERIEVLRGNQSTLYGSNAIGGVINIITKHGNGAPGGWTTLEAGSYNTYKAISGVSGKVDNVGFNVSASRFTTSGFSAFDKEKGGAGADGSDYANFSDRMDVKLNEMFSVYTTTRYNNSRTQFDEFGAEADDNTHAKELSWRNAVKASLFEGRWDQEIGVSYYKIDRNTTTTGLFGGYNFYRGDRTALDWVNHIKANDFNLLTLGAETQYETSRASSALDKDSQRVNGYFAQDQITFSPQFYTTVGARVDDNDRFGNKTTYRIAPVYTVENTGTRLKASYGTGFKAPSLFQLFSSFGNPDLKPEESIGYDFGFEQPFLKNTLQMGSTFFHNNISNLIDYDFATNKYLNVNSIRANGVENFVKVFPVPDMSVKLQYTYTDAYSEAAKQQLLRRARHKASIDADYTFLEKGRAGINAFYNGRRDDIDFNFNRTELPSSVVVNVTGSWQLTDSALIFGRVDNLLNKRYENVYGYGTAGLSAYAGVTVRY